MDTRGLMLLQPYNVIIIIVVIMALDARELKLMSVFRIVSAQQIRQNIAGNTSAPIKIFFFATLRVSYVKKKCVQYPRAGVRNLRAVFILERYCMHRRPGDLKHFRKCSGIIHF